LLKYQSLPDRLFTPPHAEYFATHSVAHISALHRITVPRRKH